jgi:hypothetical protein
MPGLPPLAEDSVESGVEPGVESGGEPGHNALQSYTSVAIRPNKPKRKLQAFTSTSIPVYQAGGKSEHDGSSTSNRGSQRTGNSSQKPNVSIRKWLTQQQNDWITPSNTMGANKRITLYSVLQKVLDGWTFLLLIGTTVTYVPWYVAFWPYIDKNTANAFRALEVVMDILFFLAAEINVDGHAGDDDQSWEPYMGSENADHSLVNPTDRSSLVSPTNAFEMTNPMERRTSLLPQGRTKRTESMASRLHGYTVTTNNRKVLLTNLLTPWSHDHSQRYLLASYSLSFTLKVPAVDGTEAKPKITTVRVKYQDLVGAVPYQFLVLVPGSLRLKQCLGLLSLLKLMRLSHVNRLKGTRFLPLPPASSRFLPLPPAPSLFSPLSVSFSPSSSPSCKARNDHIKKRLDGLSMNAQVIRLVSGLVISAHIIGE